VSLVAKMAEPIDTLFGEKTRSCGPKNRVSSGGTYGRLNNPCSAVMWAVNGAAVAAFCNFVRQGYYRISTETGH